MRYYMQYYKQYKEEIYIVALALCLALVFYLLIPSTATLHAPQGAAVLSSRDVTLPDFSSYSQVSEKKLAFFSFMLPLIEQENRRIAEQREKLAALEQQAADLNAEQLQWLGELVEQYRIDARQRDREQLLEELLLRVDQVPPSLALAQSATESGWGTSRFAVEGNNLFGQWCFSEGCGLVPGRRPEQAVHEVAVFPSPRDSVASYIRNLNTNPAYKAFREIRAKQRQQTGSLSGIGTATGLLKYSSRGVDYVEEIRSMIRLNDLDRYDSI